MFEYINELNDSNDWEKRIAAQPQRQADPLSDRPRQWTPEMVKEELPNIRVAWNGDIYLAAVRGRANRFATVYIFAHYPYRGNNFNGPSFEVAWSTIAHVINTNGNLKV